MCLPGLIVVGLVSALLGCEPAQPSGLGEKVQLRLGAEDFGFDTAGPRGPSAVIGDEIRPVVAGVESIKVFDAREVAPGANSLEVAVVFPDRAAEMPVSSFVVSFFALGERDGGMAERWRELAGTNWSQLEDGWTLIRDTSGGGVLRLAAEALEGRSLLRLSAVRPPPRTLDSRAFGVTAGAVLELGYGLLDPMFALPGSSTEFTTSLACDGADFRVVNQARIDHKAEDARWIDVRVALPKRTHSCRLQLATRARGDESVAAVWSVPRIVGPPASGEKERRNLVLISLDTLRADRLSGYGYPRHTSPVIDGELIARGTRFTDLSTTYPRTNVAHMGMFTGLYPAAFGSLWFRLAFTSPIRTMTERLAESGVETVAFTEGGLMSRRQGFWYGFDRFAEHGGTGHARETFKQGVAFLDRARDKHFFLFLHTYQTHTPYRPAPEYAELFDPADDSGPHRRVPAKYRGASTLYDREIRQTDALLEEFLERLDSLGLSENTYVALISDHGEAFGEHRVLFHGQTAYQEELRIPFVIRGPGIPAGRVIDESLSIVDVGPTLLDLLNAPPLAQSQGRSLSAALLEDAPILSKPVFFEWNGRGRPRGVRHGRFKVLQRHRTNQHLIVYDLDADPAEQRPIRGPHPARERGRELLASYEEEGSTRAAALPPTGAEPDAAPLPRDIRAELRALGYVE